MQEESKEKSKDAPFESLRILSERWKNGTFSEIIDDWKPILFEASLDLLEDTLVLKAGSIVGHVLYA